MKYDPFSKGLRCRIFDIETTGLYSGKDRIISASFIDPDGSNLVQYFTEAPAAEDFTVSKILSELLECDVVITYNGNGFDLPFVLARANKYGLCDKLPLFRSVDVYKLLRHYWPLAETMESLRQKAVEKVLGLSDDRTDEIDGGQCIRLYSEYTNFGRDEAKDLILLHNADDVRQLAAITEKLSFLPYYRIAFEQGIYTKVSSLSLLESIEHRILTGPAKLSNGKLSVKGRIDPPCMPTAYYEDSYNLQSDNKGRISLDIAAREAEGMVFCDLTKLPVNQEDFTDLESFNHGYLVLANQAETNFRACSLLISSILKTLA